MPIFGWLAFILFLMHEHMWLVFFILWIATKEGKKDDL